MALRVGFALPCWHQLSGSADLHERYTTPMINVEISGGVVHGFAGGFRAALLAMLICLSSGRILLHLLEMGI